MMDEGQGRREWEKRREAGGMEVMGTQAEGKAGEGVRRLG